MPADACADTVMRDARVKETELIANRQSAKGPRDGSLPSGALRHLHYVMVPNH
jgi:hypothetical protein